MGFLFCFEKPNNHGIMGLNKGSVVSEIKPVLQPFE